MSTSGSPAASAAGHLADLALGDALPDLVADRINRTTLALFAGASGDHNPMHIDVDTARSAGADDVFAHGMLSAAYLGRLLAGWAPQSALRSLEVRFRAITPVQATPRCQGTVSAIEEQDDGPRLVTIELSVVLEDGTVTLTGHAVLTL